MQCGVFQDKLADWLGDELNPAERVEFEKHANQCAVCRKELEQLSHAARAVHMLRPSEAAVAAGVGRVALPVAATPRRWSVAAALLRYAAVIAFAFVAGFVSRGAPPTETAARPSLTATTPAAAAPPTIHPRIARNYQRAADQHPNASTLGLSLLSIARR